MNNNTKPQEETTWEKGFDGHADAQMLRLSRLSFEEKLKWLDEFNRFFLGLRSSESSTTRPDP